MKVLCDKSRGYVRFSHRNLKTVRYMVTDPFIGLNTKEQELYEQAEQFAVLNFKPNAIQWDEFCTFPRGLMLDLGRLGYGGMLVSRDKGGMGLTRGESLCIIEALAKYCVGTTAMLTIHNACTNIISKHALPEVMEEWLEKLCKFERMVSFCLTEPGSGSDAASISTTVTPLIHNNNQNTHSTHLSHDFTITGQKVFISGAGQSDLYLVMAKNAFKEDKNAFIPGLSSFLVPKETAGLSFGQKEKKMGWRVQPTRPVYLEDVRLFRHMLLGREGEGFKIAMGGLDGARLSVAACSLGAAQRGLEMVRRRVRDSSLPVDNALLHTLADIAGGIVQSRLLLREAARLLEEKEKRSIVYCAMTKCVATEQCSEVLGKVMQTLDYPALRQEEEVERLVRDVRVHHILEGTNEIMRTILGRSLVS